MPKKSKLDTLNQAHGKIEKPVTLDQVWGNDGRSKYGTLDLDEYTNYLNDLNKSDLQSHAIKIGLVPVDNRESLVKRLKAEFTKFSSQFKQKPSPKNNNVSKKAKDILAEGR
jgi:hypothetical protein